MSLWYPGATRRPGRMSNYARGRNGMRATKLHYTVGINSDPIGMRGYFTFLISRDGSVRQYAPVDALVWDSGEWNTEGPGIEAEYLASHDGPPGNILNDRMLRAAGGLVGWLHEVHRFPLAYYDGPRIGKPFRGFITHRSLVQSQPHSDYWSAAHWAALTGHTGLPVTAPVTPRPVAVDSLIRAGSPASRISALQGWLAQAGFDPGPVDGLWGPRTEGAVRAFQRAARITVDGIAGPQTLGHLYGALISRAKAAPPAAAPTGTALAAFVAAVKRSVLRKGSRGLFVKVLQKHLHIPADGIFGPQTKRAVRAYQSRHRLGVDGIVGPQTWGSLIP